MKENKLLKNVPQTNFPDVPAKLDFRDGGRTACGGLERQRCKETVSPHLSPPITQD